MKPIEKRDVTQELIETIETLQTIGVDISRLTTKDTIKTLAEKSGVSEEEIKKVGLNPDTKIGQSKNRRAEAYRGKVRGRKPTEEQVARLLELGISIEKRDTTQEFIETLEILQTIEVDVSKIAKKDTIKTLGEKSGVSEEALKRVGLNPDEPIGVTRSSMSQAYRGKGTMRKPTEEQVARLLELGISLEKRDVTQEFIETVETLQTIEVNVSKLTTTDTIKTLAEKSGISEEEIKKVGLNPDDKIGVTKNTVTQAYRGNGTWRKPTEEQVVRLLELGISLERKRRRTGKEIVAASISSLMNIEMANREDVTLRNLTKRGEKGEIEPNE